MKKYILIVSLLIPLFGIARLTTSKPVAKAGADGCKCYANGTAFSPGSRECIGGFRAVCAAREGVGENARNCGWDYLLDSNGNYIRCN